MFSGTRGTCQPCGAVETPYDGVDNDCDPSTPDRDLDGDGQIDEAVGGLDCDDQDPTVTGGPTAAEVCDDGKDNNCDGVIDEITCRDFAPPTVRIIEPTINAVVAGAVPVRIEASDDAQLMSLRFSVDGTTIDETRALATMSTVFETTVDTTQLTDGNYVLRAAAIDVAGRSALSQVPVVVDNTGAPRITIISPSDGASRAGEVSIRATAVDEQGVVAMNIRFDDQFVGTSTGGAVGAQVRVSDIDGTLHDILFEALDADGNRGTALITVRADHSGPTIRFIEPAPGASVDDPVDLVIEATDSAGVAEISAYGRRGVGGPEDTSLRLSFRLEPVELPPEATELVASAIDATNVGFGVGNSATETLPVTRFVSVTQFDPDKVYFVGTLRPGIAFNGVVCDLERPNQPLAGIDTAGNIEPIIRSTGRMVYYDISNGQVRMFASEPLTVDSDGRPTIPQNWRDNDPLLPTPPCNPGSGLGMDFTVNPVNDEFTWLCGDGLGWRTATGTITTCRGLRKFGRNGGQLCSDEVRAPDGTIHRLVDRLTQVEVLRPKPTGGWWWARGNVRDGLERWSISNRGVATRDGVYAPSNHPSLAPTGAIGEFDAAGNAYVVGNAFPSDENTIIRFNGDFLTNDVVYEEAGPPRPLCQLFAPLLVSGQ